MVCAYEQRRWRRSEVAWPVSLWHPKATRFFNGRSINVSGGGVLMRLPLQTPLREGESVELNFPRGESLAKEKGQFGRLKNARVIRIDRGSALSSATMEVGLAFVDAERCSVDEPASASI